jgi:hypothetical protein
MTQNMKYVLVRHPTCMLENHSVLIQHLQLYTCVHYWAQKHVTRF